MTVFENVLTAKHLRLKSNVFSAMLHLNGAEEKRMREETLALLRTVGLEALKDETASSLPYGKQRLLEIARALATGPRLLLLDEPAAGMNPQETEELSAFIRRIKEQFGLTIFIIEHHMNLVMEISDRIYVIDFGRLIAQGTPAEIQENPAVIAAYLGGGRSMSLLEIKDLKVSYGGIEALKGISSPGKARRNRHPDRGQRRGKIHHAAGYFRLGSHQIRGNYL